MPILLGHEPTHAPGRGPGGGSTTTGQPSLVPGAYSVGHRSSASETPSRSPSGGGRGVETTPCFAAALSRPCWPCSPATPFARSKPLTSPPLFDFGEQCGSQTACAGPAEKAETANAPAIARAKQSAIM